MSSVYWETLEGQRLLRSAPGERHEAICQRLHRCVEASVSNLNSTLLLPPRAEVRLSGFTTICPDLALLAVATGKVWLAAEVVSSDDHRPDTFLKKQIYEELKLPRLWMVDPRYNNVEVYHATKFGLSLKCILGGKELLTEKLLPEFEICIEDLFSKL
jgi:Uma2 family endonuclease